MGTELFWHQFLQLRSAIKYRQSQSPLLYENRSNSNSAVHSIPILLRFNFFMPRLNQLNFF